VKTARLAALMLAVAVGCEPDPTSSAVAHARSYDRDVHGEAAPWSDAALDAEADRYLHDAEFRRAILEASLTNPDNLYSSTRLGSYGLGDRGWDALPEWTPAAIAIGQRHVDALVGGDPVSLERAAPLWDGRRPQSFAQWVELGRRVFFEYPLRPEIFAEHALRHPEVAAASGLRPDAHGHWPGVVAFRDIDGRAQIGITCALCHVAIEDGAIVEGRARRELDYGAMRLAYHRDTGAPLPEALAQRMAGWGPGRADITQDDDEDPVAIVDLWGVRGRAWLTQAGTLRHVHPAALAIRQETQILHANLERTRPPRELAWALAMYVYSLQPPARPPVELGATSEHGRGLFARHCAHCHADSDHSGTPIDAATIGTDPTLAFGRARGTGLYRPSPLVRVADAAPYLHHGVVPTLDALLGPERFAADHPGGPIPGHRFGTSLPADDRRALVAFLATL
jgi:cytochrome c5